MARDALLLRLREGLGWFNIKRNPRAVQAVGEPALSNTQLTVAEGWLVAISKPPVIAVAVHETPGEVFTPGSSEQSPEKYVRVSR